jgi:hypothetical protein
MKSFTILMLYYFVIVTITQKEYFSQSIDHLDGDYDSEVSIQELKNDETNSTTNIMSNENIVDYFETQDDTLTGKLFY